MSSTASRGPDRGGWRRAIALVTALTFVAALIPAAAFAKPPVTVPPPTYPLTGTVRAWDGSTPLKSVTVDVYTPAGDWVTTVVTDAMGDFTVNAPAGDYRLGFDPRIPNVADSLQYLGGYYSSYSSVAAAWADATDIPLSTGGTAVGDVYLDTGTAWTGTVSGAGFGVLPFATVTAIDVTDPGRVYATTADSTGWYYLVAPAGSYYLFFEPDRSATPQFLSRYWNGAIDQAHATKVAGDRGATSTGVDQTLPEGGFLEGMVYKPGGSVAATGVSVSVWDEGAQMGSTFSDEITGGWKIGPLEPGRPVSIVFDPDWGPAFDAASSFNAVHGTSYVMQTWDNRSFKDPRLETPVAGSTITGINATLDNGGSITGEVQDPSGNQLAGVLVTLSGQGSGVFVETTTTTGGAYTAGNLPRDHWDAYAKPQAYNEANNTDFLPTWYDDNPIILSGTATAAPSPLVLQPGARISGRVMNSSSVGLVGVDVYAHLADGNDTPVLTKSTGSGVYALRGVPEARMKVEFDPWQYNDTWGTGWVGEYSDSKATFRTADVMRTVAGTAINGVDARLARGGTITGIVRGPGGVPLDGAYVQLYDSDGVEVTGAGSSTYAVGGVYTLSAVRPGIYKVKATSGAAVDGFGAPLVYPARWYNGKRWASEADNIVVAAGSVLSSINIQLLNGPVVSGTVLGDGGVPLEKVDVVLRDPTGNEWDRASTAIDGSYSLNYPNDIIPGTYYVQFDPAPHNATYAASYGMAYYQWPTASAASVAAANPVTLGYGSVVGSINGRLSTTGAGQIFGTAVVRNAGTNPYEPGTFYSVRAWERFGTTWRPVAQAAVDAPSGDFTIKGLRQGVPYKLSFEDEDIGLAPYPLAGTYGRQFWVDDSPATSSVSWPEIATTITPGPSPSSRTFAVQKGGLFTVFAWDQTPGEPLENVDVYAEYRKDGVWWPIGGTGYVGYTTAGGELDLPSEAAYDIPMMPGEYRFRFEREGYDTVWFEDALTSADASSVALTPFDPLAWTDVRVEQTMYPSGLTSAAIAGADRYQVAADLARIAYPGFTGVTNVVIASGLEKAAADPLSAGGLAGVYGAPILLVRQDRLTITSPTAAALSQISAANPGSKIKIWIVGGPVSVPEALKTQITKALGGTGRLAGYTRFTGADRYTVAASVAAHVRSKTGNAGCFITNASAPLHFWDALAVSPVSYRMHYPVLLTKAGSIPAATKAEAAKYLTRYVIGDATHVPESVRAALTADRISGTTRADVAARFAEKAWERGWTGIGTVAVGNKLPDSLVGGATMGALGGSMLYTGDGVNTARTLDPRTAQFFTNYNMSITDVMILGGPASMDKPTLMRLIEGARAK